MKGTPPGNPSLLSSLQDQATSTLEHQHFVFYQPCFLIVVLKVLLVTNVKCRVQIMNVKIIELVSLQMQHNIVGMYQVLVTKQYVERKTGRSINLPIGLV